MTPDRVAIPPYDTVATSDLSASPDTTVVAAFEGGNVTFEESGEGRGLEFVGPVDEVRGWMDACSMEACGMSVSSYPWVKEKRNIRVCGGKGEREKKKKRRKGKRKKKEKIHTNKTKKQTKKQNYRTVPQFVTLIH